MTVFYACAATTLCVCAAAVCVRAPVCVVLLCVCVRARQGGSWAREGKARKGGTGDGNERRGEREDRMITETRRSGLKWDGVNARDWRRRATLSLLNSISSAHSTVFSIAELISDV